MSSSCDLGELPCRVPSALGSPRPMENSDVSPAFATPWVTCHGHASLATPTNQNGTDRFDGLETIYRQAIRHWAVSSRPDITVIPTKKMHNVMSTTVCMYLFIPHLLLSFTCLSLQRLEPQTIVQNYTVN
jgi:hypothetical protein